MSTPETTRLLLTDVINQHLTSKGLDASVTNQIQVPAEYNKLSRAIRKLCQEIYQKHSVTFANMLARFHISPDTLHQNLQAVMMEMFSDQVNWGRIVTLYSFCMALAEQCIIKEMPQLVQRVIEWTSVYIDVHIQSWIDGNHGWDDFVTSFYDPDKQASRPEWPSMWNMCGYAAGAVGLFTLAAVMTSKG